MDNETQTIIRCYISEVYQLSENILMIDIQAEKEFDLKDFEQLVDAAFELGKGKKFYNLIKVGSHTLPSHDARVASTSKEGSIYKMADAFVIHSFSQKLVGNFYMNFHKPYVPTKFFNSIEKAKAWLLDLQEHNKKFEQNSTLN